MPKSGVVGGAGRARTLGHRRPAELPSAVGGQIAEICRDLAVEAKRMRQLQEQADELHKVFRRWVAESEADGTITESVVEDDAEK
jgi:hypothetical protein